MTASEAIKNARIRAGLTQAELAKRLGTTQSAIARLETPGANPTVTTLERALAETGHRLLLVAARSEPGVDETLIANRLRLSPGDRLKSFESFNRDARQIMLAGQRARGEHAA
ncbi:MAG TPA: helix-turn-helix transcriptional regulator [Solirubrobacteraceae bacterium]